MASKTISINFLERPVISQKDPYVMQICHASIRELRWLRDLLARGILSFWRFGGRFKHCKIFSDSRERSSIMTTLFEKTAVLETDWQLFSFEASKWFP